MQDAPKAVWSIPYVSVAVFPSLKQFFAYRSSKVSSRPDCMIFEIHQLWQSDFSKVYSNCCCSCSFEAEILKIGLPSHKMYSNNIVNFRVSTTILNACTKKAWKLIVCPSYIVKVKLATIVEGSPKVPLSIATTTKWRVGRYSFPWIAPLYPWSLTYSAEC